MVVATNVAEYVRRIQEALGDREPMAVLNQTAGALLDLSQALTTKEMQYRSAENQWSIAEIMAHLADAEVVTTFRVLHILTNVDGVGIPAYDQDAYASVRRYRNIPRSQSLTMFTSLRKANLGTWNTLTSDQLNKFGMHVERGKETVGDLLRLIAGHDLNHLGQIERLLPTRRTTH